MFADPKKYEKYAQFIFPQKITVQNKEFGSTFHTFTTEEDGSQSFFHCFTFYEQIHYNQVVQDFDTKGVQMEMLEKKLNDLAAKAASE